MATIDLCGGLDHLATIRTFVAETSRDLSADEQDISDLCLAVDEICANVFIHGYDRQGGRIEVTLGPTEDGIQVSIRDWGKAFEPQQVPIPDVDCCLEERPLGGLGLFLVYRLMDEVRFEFDGERGNLVTLLKRTRREEEK
jgi:serine/threonine-protein kinase RsbW